MTAGAAGEPTKRSLAARWRAKPKHVRAGIVGLLGVGVAWTWFGRPLFDRLAAAGDAGPAAVVLGQQLAERDTTIMSLRADLAAAKAQATACPRQNHLVLWADRYWGGLSDPAKLALLGTNGGLSLCLSAQIYEQTMAALSTTSDPCGYALAADLSDVAHPVVSLDVEGRAHGLPPMLSGCATSTRPAGVAELPRRSGGS